MPHAGLRNPGIPIVTAAHSGLGFRKRHVQVQTFHLVIHSAEPLLFWSLLCGSPFLEKRQTLNTRINKAVSDPNQCPGTIKWTACRRHEGEEGGVRRGGQGRLLGGGDIGAQAPVVGGGDIGAQARVVGSSQGVILL